MTCYTKVLCSLQEREKICWDMAKVFLENKDAHGVMDMGAELQSLQRAIQEIKRLGETSE
jgi:hypothetical protein